MEGNNYSHPKTPSLTSLCVCLCASTHVCSCSYVYQALCKRKIVSLGWGSGRGGRGSAAFPSEDEWSVLLSQDGWRWVKEVKDRGSCLIYCFFKPDHATKGINLCLKSIHYMYLCPFSVIWRSIMQFRRFIGMLVFHQNAGSAVPHACFVVENGISSQRFLDVLLVKQLNIRKPGNQGK